MSERGTAWPFMVQAPEEAYATGGVCSMIDRGAGPKAG